MSEKREKRPLKAAMGKEPERSQITAKLEELQLGTTRILNAQPCNKWHKNGRSVPAPPE